MRNIVSEFARKKGPQLINMNEPDLVIVRVALELSLTQV
jgi:hypothetical protein